MDETLQRKVEEMVYKISSEFCSWLRNLPGNDKTVNETKEEKISALFNTSFNPNPVKSSIGEGLMSWAKFGSSVSRVSQESTIYITLSRFMFLPMACVKPYK